MSSLKSILNLCGDSLECILVHGRCSNVRWILGTLGKYSFIRLKKLEITRFEGGESVFSRLIENCPNLQEFTWDSRCYRGEIFPAGVCAKLESVTFTCAADELLDSMIGKVPRLTQFRIMSSFSPISTSTLDKFFLSFPKLEILTLACGDLPRMKDIWKLSSLTELSIRKLGMPLTDLPISDDILQKIATSFPRLQTFDLFYQGAVTAAGIGALAALKDLREISIRHVNFPESNIA